MPLEFEINPALAAEDRKDDPRVKTIVRVGCWALTLIALFTIWYSVAANYDYGALAGSYVFRGEGETCTLYLRPDGPAFTKDYSPRPVQHLRTDRSSRVELVC